MRHMVDSLTRLPLAVMGLLALGPLASMHAMENPQHTGNSGLTPEQQSLLNLSQDEMSAALNAYLATSDIITWEAGTHRLQDILTKVNHENADVLLQLGVDQNALAEFTDAFSGSYWEAVLAIAQQYDLSIVQDPWIPASTRPVNRYSTSRTIQVKAPPQISLKPNRGPILLGPPKEDQAQYIPVGPFLLQMSDGMRHHTRLLSGSERWVSFKSRLKGAPHLPQSLEMVAQLRLENGSVNGEATDSLKFGQPADAHLLRPMNSTTRSYNVFQPQRTRVVAPSTPFYLSGLPAGAGTAELSVQCAVLFTLPWTLQPELELDTITPFKFGDNYLEVALITAQGAENFRERHAQNRAWHRENTAAISYRKEDFPRPPRLTVEQEVGDGQWQRLTTRGSSRGTTNNREYTSLRLPLLDPQVRYRLSLTGTVDLGEAEFTHVFPLELP